jgi:hypothetical protein
LALTPQNNDAFFREVDDEVRRERATQMARRYGVIVAALVVVALVALGGVLAWRSHAGSVANATSERFTGALSALSSGNTADAKTKLDALIKDDPKGYTPLARITEADMLVQQGKDKDAAAAFDVIAADTGVPQPLRDLATVRATALEFDGIAPQQAIDRLKPLAVAGNAWYGSAGEMTAIAYLKLNQPQKAGPLFAAITKDKTVPQSIRTRTGQMASDLGIDVVQPADSARP